MVYLRGPQDGPPYELRPIGHLAVSSEEFLKDEIS